MRTIEEKLASLNATSVWYFAKQDTNFDNAFKAVQIVDELGQQWEDDGTTAWSTKAASKGLDSNHRILSVAQLLGLLTKNNPFGKSQYKSETPTPVYRAISRYAIGSPEYNALKTEQLLKLRMNAITDTRPESADYNIAPVLFTYEVFWRLKAKGVTEVSLGDFYTYVMTCKTHEEIDECVEHLLDPNRKETPYVANYKGDSRVVTLIQNNLNLIQFTSTTVSIKPEFADYFDYFFNGAYTSFVNMMKFVVSDVQMYQTILTNPIGLAVNFLDTSAKIDIGVKRINLENKKSESYSLQQIHYGAPGTGKSHIVKKRTEGESVVRTTFHPDSDYSTFVGCYKPTTKEIEMRDVTGKVIVEHGQPVTENRIIYQFVEQAFLQAYIKSWKFYAEAEEGAAPKKQFLIIEEINRGNCAQIFGDLFQLLDRNDSGFSEYFIHADKDMQKHISNAFKDCLIKESHKDTINSLYPKDDDVVAKVLSGEILLLPNNLYIWATMNTSDQSLFPIDSAFKRRWDWEYEPIKYKNINWVIDIKGSKYLWTSFQREINKRIFNATNSEDKMLGDYFVNPADGVITEKILLNKILFYLWNDVCKDGEGDIFKTNETTDISFSELHGEGGSEKLVAMMKYLGVSLENNTIEENLDIEPLDQERKTWYLNLWTDIRKSLENNGQQNLPNARDRQTYQLSVGLTGISVLANISKTKANGFVCYYVEKQQANDIYPKLLNLKDTIENSLGELEWHREDNKYGIAKRNIELTSINDSSTRNELIEQISKLLIDFKATIIPLVDQLR